MILKIEGITQKGKNRISEGLGEEVKVISTKEDRIAIAPINDPSFSSKFVRWIKKEKDTDFKIVKIINSGCI